MKASSYITRRRLIGGVAAGTALATGSVFYVDNELPRERQSALKHYLKSRQALSKLGTAYLSEHPDKADADALVASLFNDETSEYDVGAKVSLSELQTLLAAKVKSDFVNHRLVRIDGWMVSRTEAQLSALVAVGF